MSNDIKKEEIDYNKVLETGFKMGAAAIAGIFNLDITDEMATNIYNKTIERYKAGKNVRS